MSVIILHYPRKKKVIGKCKDVQKYEFLPIMFGTHFKSDFNKRVYVMSNVNSYVV